MRKFRMFSVVLLALMMLVSGSAFAQEAEVPEGEPVVTLEREPCFGFCPVYTIAVYEDGTVVFNGQQNVEVEGEQTINVGEQYVQMLIDSFVESDYFEWEDEYLNMDVSDAPYVNTSVTVDGETKSIRHYHGDFSAPIELSYLENWIDWIVSSDQWTGQAPQPPFSSEAGPAVITLQREPCFGFCPVYSLAIHEDGTVVYIGFLHVEEVGVRTTSIEPEAVEELAEAMVEAGYFEWQDEYLDQPMSDAPTTITSLTWDGNYKRIERYGGDDSAPDELAEFEDMIDDAVEEIEEWTATPDEPPSR